MINNEVKYYFKKKSIFSNFKFTNINSSKKESVFTTTLESLEKASHKSPPPSPQKNEGLNNHISRDNWTVNEDEKDRDNGEDDEENNSNESNESDNQLGENRKSSAENSCENNKRIESIPKKKTSKKAKRFWRRAACRFISIEPTKEFKQNIEEEAINNDRSRTISRKEDLINKQNQNQVAMKGYVRQTNINGKKQISKTAEFKSAMFAMKEGIVSPFQNVVELDDYTYVTNREPKSLKLIKYDHFMFLEQGSDFGGLALDVQGAKRYY